MGNRIGKRFVDGLAVTGKEYFAWDDDLPGFGVRVRASGTKAYVFQYRAGAGRSAPSRRVTIGSTSNLSPDQARKIASLLSGEVRRDRDPAAERAAERKALTVAELVEEFLSEHVKAKRKVSTLVNYRYLLRDRLAAEFGSTRASRLTRQELARLHSSMRETPYQANAMLRAVGSLYSYAAVRGHVPEGYNPARKIELFPSQGRERYLSARELEQLGTSLRLGETEGLPWVVDESKPKTNRTPKTGRATVIEPHASAAIRLLLLTGCRLREILHLEWDHVDLERGLLNLADSKTGRKTVILNAPALKVLANVEEISRFVIAGEHPERPRRDLKRPWAAVTRHAGLTGLRVHDLRHNFASFGAGGGLGLPIIGKLLGHSQPATTARYAHLDADPLRRASDKIAGTIAAAFEGKAGGNVVKLNRKGKTR
jgi:integrase